MDPATRTNRTWLCCVIFTDIVGYSMHSTSAQMAMKENFNRYLGEALKDVAVGDKVILDTGDGAAICISDPEEALFACLAMQGFFVQRETVAYSDFEVRIGINLGSVKLIRDLNGNLNAVGDGINVAQRVMSFAAPNQILVSRSYFEVASSLSDEYKRLFSYEGVRTDKHVKEHSVYKLAAPEQRVTPVPQVVAEPSATNSGRVESGWPPELLRKVEVKLALAVGPIARVLVRNAARTKSEWGAFSHALAEQIPTAREKADFVAFCQRLKPASP